MIFNIGPFRPFMDEISIFENHSAREHFYKQCKYYDAGIFFDVFKPNMFKIIDFRPYINFWVT